MKTYTYSGPPSGVTLAGGKEVPLHPGKDVELDPDNPYVKTLVARGRLVEVTAQAPEPETTPAKTVKGAKP